MQTQVPVNDLVTSLSVHVKGYATAYEGCG